ncbi:2-(3-amino-3-carboxypropyl)histidine synthase subunit 2 [Selaginella moellendorffii]|uniref:2-(3-amino-3-carboxypropyl)histidine synthase subunit 2 n=1 Tax=Selaginella moellendorffii TaxID=88036 RepID=UPI000D1C8986|nr:2-(3-amino-3-carboxypropyl)histidine synthase subunit 2 [Selaginella moellendorffii]XP_024521772.1 2-(3-amino-3-carboxypropyl)histidine synthase subunit 2 [Selaginella moellendorffii]|eukprot:XP_024521771.1 2-(3-amino-3-carboxypropyl)histidine synthase subunit 2 [Selaginella moellendorffii]
MALLDRYEVASTAAHIQQHGFSRVGLQFPDNLLADSVAVTSALQSACGSGVRFFIMADTTFGSCCVDEVAAAHVNADCVVHYGPACLSPVTNLPAYFVFLRTPLDINTCGEVVADLVAKDERLLVLYDLEYAHAIPELRETVRQEAPENSGLTFAEIIGRELNPCKCDEEPILDTDEHSIGGLKWKGSTPTKILWIGKEGPALTNVMLTYNSAATVRYDPASGEQTSMSSQSSTLWRRYYLIERAKDANIVGIVVGTLGVAGYKQAIQNVKQMVKSAGKKSYTLAVGKPNPAKLANFPECDVFVLIACPQTALVDNKEFFAPLLTTFEAQLAFVRGKQWTGSYSLDFRDVQLPADPQDSTTEEEPRFSFISGGYVSSRTAVDNKDEESSGDLVAVGSDSSSIGTLSTVGKSPGTRTAADFFASRSFQGLELEAKSTKVSKDGDLRAVTGRKGRAAVYEDEQ